MARGMDWISLISRCLPVSTRAEALLTARLCLFACRSSCRRCLVSWTRCQTATASCCRSWSASQQVGGLANCRAASSSSASASGFVADWLPPPPPSPFPPFLCSCGQGGLAVGAVCCPLLLPLHRTGGASGAGALKVLTVTAFVLGMCSCRRKVGADGQGLTHACCTRTCRRHLRAHSTPMKRQSLSSAHWTSSGGAGRPSLPPPLPPPAPPQLLVLGASCA